MIRFVFALLAALALTACKSIDSPMDDGYQVGDLTGTALTLQARYCITADPYQRAVALALLHKARAPIPERGVCTDILELIDPPELSGVDVEAAEADRERFTPPE